MIKLYNTLTGRKEPLKPVKDGKIGMYACGPTVYDFFHVGNARVFIIFDVLRRYLLFRGYDVTFVQNFTDIDDKMINRAAEMGISVRELADHFIAAYQEDAAALGILPADYHPRATDFIPQMIALIQKLVAQKIAYEVEGDVYFHVESFPGYGKFSQQGLNELALGARVEIDERKKHPIDFALWKKQKEGEPSWDSPWGKGRPGWHIECSAMSMYYLGNTLDIHAGGQDLIFPHHENEIAQSEGATGQTFARHWVHAGYLNINKEKMSKSLGNVLTVRELREKIDPFVLRFFMLSAHYRSPINFTSESLEQAARALERLNTLIYNLKERLPKVEKGSLDDQEEDLMAFLRASKEKFREVLDDDFNTAEGLAVLFELARKTNVYLNRSGGQKSNVLRPILDFYQETDQIFTYLRQDSPTFLEKEIEALVLKREEARARKNWALADALRNQLKERGVILEDTPQGVRWKLETGDKKQEAEDKG